MVITQEEKPSLKRWLDEVDARNAARLSKFRQRLDGLDRRSAQKWRIVWHGANKKTKPMQRTGSRFQDILSRWRFKFCRFLAQTDTRFFFRGRPYQAKTCRVRSRSERVFADWLTNRGLRFQYEKPLIVGVKRFSSRVFLKVATRLPLTEKFKKALVKEHGGVWLRPDFYLPDSGVYVEYWGLSDKSAEYDVIRRSKESLYRKHGIRIISIEPRKLPQLGRYLDKVFPTFFLEATRQELP